jgi:hypothetical protein
VFSLLLYTPFRSSKEEIQLMRELKRKPIKYCVDLLLGIEEKKVLINKKCYEKCLTRLPSCWLGVMAEFQQKRRWW